MMELDDGQMGQVSFSDTFPYPERTECQFWVVVTYEVQGMEFMSMVYLDSDWIGNPVPATSYSLFMSFQTYPKGHSS